jgi:hypothetical protein
MNDPSPTLGGTFNATSHEAHNEVERERNEGMNREVLTHRIEPIHDKPPQDVTGGLDDARRAVQGALQSQPYSPDNNPLQSVGSQPLPGDGLSNGPVQNNDAMQFNPMPAMPPIAPINPMPPMPQQSPIMPQPGMNPMPPMPQQTPIAPPNNGMPPVPMSPQMYPQPNQMPQPPYPPVQNGNTPPPPAGGPPPMPPNTPPPMPQF